MKRYFLFDCETGGLDPSHSLLTLHGKVLDENYETKGVIDLAIRHETYQVEVMALEINKIDLVSHHRTAISKEKAMRQLDTFLLTHTNLKETRLIPAGHNVGFDLVFARELLPTFDQYVSHRTLDTASLAHFYQDLGLIDDKCDLSLSSLANFFGIPSAGNHNAAVDAEITRQVLLAFRGLAQERKA